MGNTDRCPSCRSAQCSTIVSFEVHPFMKQTLVAEEELQRISMRRGRATCNDADVAGFRRSFAPT
jgi:hypothetical protein